MYIGLKIKDLRKSKKISQKELAERIGIDNSQLSKIEQGKLQPTIQQIIDLSSIFEVPTDWLLQNQEECNTSQKIQGDNNLMAGNNLTTSNNEAVILQLKEEINTYKSIIREKDIQINNLISLLKKN